MVNSPRLGHLFPFATVISFITCISLFLATSSSITSLSPSSPSSSTTSHPLAFAMSFSWAAGSWTCPPRSWACLPTASLTSRPGCRAEAALAR